MAPLDSFIVMEREFMQEHTCDIRILSKDHLDQVAQLQDTVVEGMKDKSLFFPLTLEEISYILTDQGGIALGAFVKDRLIGLRCLYFPRDREDNLGKDIGLSQEALAQVAHLEASFVHPAFQGNSLQKKMTALLFNNPSLLKGQRFLLATVMPHNSPSIIDKFVQSMRIVALKEKYGTGWRYIFFRDMQQPLGESNSKADNIAVSPADIARQMELLAEGYQGLSYEKSAPGITINYAK